MSDSCTRSLFIGQRQREGPQSNASMTRAQLNSGHGHTGPVPIPSAWLHDLESFYGVTAALDWMCLKYLQVTTTRDQDLIENKLSEAGAAASVPAELVTRDPDHDPTTGDVSGVEPSSWFSSLWTLQECALCPELELCSRTWEVLRDRWGTPFCGGGTGRRRDDG